MHLRTGWPRHNLDPEDRAPTPAGRHDSNSSGREAHDAQHRHTPTSASVFFSGRRHRPTHCRILSCYQGFADAMTIDVVCLRPEADFERVKALPPPALKVAYRTPNDADVPSLMKQARALLIPAVGPRIPAALFEGATTKFVQVTGAGLDRLDLPALQRLGILVANVPGGSNSAVAEYAVTSASVLLRRFAWADAEIRAGNYTGFRDLMIAGNLSGLDGLSAGIVGLGVIGLAGGQAFHARGCRLCSF